MTLSYRIKWIIFTATVIPFFLYPSNALAEYYIGCESPTYKCLNCCHHPKKHVVKKHVVKHHKRSHVRHCRSSACVTVYYVTPSVRCDGCVTAPVSTCCGGRAFYNGYMDASSEPYAYTEGVNYTDWTYYDYVHNNYDYNPDLATGDDDNVIYPELQVND